MFLVADMNIEWGACQSKIERIFKIYPSKVAEGESGSDGEHDIAGGSKVA
jgi:hypothetical protein